MRILLVEPEAGVAVGLAQGLAEAGHDVDVAVDARQARELAAARTYSLCVLDKDLTCQPGICRGLLDAGHAPYVIMLSRAAGLDERLACLTCGADDHVFKPVEALELRARVQAAARRLDRFLVYGDLRLDRLTRQLSRREASVTLTNREFELLAFFMDHPEQTLTREALNGEVWSISFETRTNLVDVYVTYLRRKLARLGLTLIHTVRGSGYRFGFSE